MTSTITDCSNQLKHLYLDFQTLCDDVVNLASGELDLDAFESVNKNHELFAARIPILKIQINELDKTVKEPFKAAILSQFTRLEEKNNKLEKMIEGYLPICETQTKLDELYTQFLHVKPSLKEQTQTIEDLKNRNLQFLLFPKLTASQLHRVIELDWLIDQQQTDLKSDTDQDDEEEGYASDSDSSGPIGGYGIPWKQYYSSDRTHDLDLPPGE
ncbi:MAG TPA: hypothetical protein VLG49_01640 [Rhabdochlamydiaceae bacterium]|nr:hypothetical protein [Rhabdochlamydiaceae bacterium]HSX13227.1 hypothetical protein [Chlamydiales bacterium]